MATKAIQFEGTEVKIGQGDARVVAKGDDVFDEISEVRSTDGPGGQTGIIDVTHSKSSAKEKLAGTKDEGTYSIECNFVPSDTGQQSANTARASRELRNVEVVLSDGTKMEFTAICTTFKTNGGVDTAETASIVFEVSGDVLLTPAGV